MRIVCEKLTKEYQDVVAINNVDLNIYHGEIYGLIGRNGAGKTTLLKLISGMIFPSEGSIDVYHESLYRNVGVLIEEPGFYEKVSALNNMKMLAPLYHSDISEIENLLKLVNLWESRNRKVGKYSYGMKQRLGVAIALMGNPSVVLLDEPFNGLDPSGMAELRDIILNINQKYGTTFIISSHLLYELKRLVTKYGYIENGKLIQEYSADTSLEELEGLFTEGKTR